MKCKLLAIFLLFTHRENTSIALWILEQGIGCLHLLVVAQRVEDSTALIVVSRDDVTGKQLFDAFFVEVEILGKIVFQFFFKASNSGLASS